MGASYNHSASSSLHDVSTDTIDEIQVLTRRYRDCEDKLKAGSIDLKSYIDELLSMNRAQCETILQIQKKSKNRKEEIKTLKEKLNRLSGLQESTLAKYGIKERLKKALII